VTAAALKEVPGVIITESTVVIAIVIACPLARLYMHRWLRNFVYRISIG
jgi:hypothetical protein